MIDSAPPDSLAPEQSQRMLKWLRFSPDLEKEFRVEYEAGSVASRLTLQVMSIIMIAVTPLYDVSLLHAPEGFVTASRVLQFSVEIPIVALSLLITAWTALRKFSAAATAFAAIVVAVCLMTQRILGQPYGFIVPQDFTAITMAAVLFLGRLRLIFVLPWALVIMVMTSLFELRYFHDAGSMYGVFATWMLFTIAVIGAYSLEYMARLGWYRGRLLGFQASRDALTDLPNRRHFDLKLRELIRDAARQRKNVALLIMDIDHFKAYNDSYGHPQGDECLRRVGARLKMAMRRPRDFCARIGGEEFAAVWFNAGAQDSIRLAEELRLAIEALGIPPAPGHGERVTASGGFVQVIAPSPADTAERICADMMKAGDAALYEAKRTGRARLVVARPGSSMTPGH